MTTPTPTPAPASAPANLDAVLGRIDALLAVPTAGSTAMDAATFQTHVASELEKALAEAAAGKADLSKARLTHLKEQTATAKAVYDSGATLAQIVMFKDPWQTLPGESASKGTADVPQPAITPTTDGSGTQFKEDVLFVQTEKGARAASPLLKGLILVAKASDAAPVRKKLIAKGAAGATIVAKAGEARAILETIAAMFGITVEEPDEVLEYEFKWDVSDTISALQSAAKLEGVMAQMSGMMSAAAAAAPAAPGMAKSAGSTAPSPATPAPSSDDGPWPNDMSAAVFDEKTGLMKSADDEGLFWGRDSGKAPTTL